MLDNSKWFFPSTDGGQENGLDNTDVEHFKEKPILSLAREIVQNSIDARIKESNKPALVEFKMFNMDPRNLPGYDEIIKNLEYCIDYWKEMESEKTVKSLNEILTYYKQSKICCLRISDFNTTGLVGVYRKQHSSWYKLIRGSGISDKNNDSGGSKGIGKFASFSNSILRTVFYSTTTTESETGHIGTIRLCSAKIPNTKKVTTGVGYYSETNEEGVQAKSGQLSLDKDFIRDESNTGTDIFILGFNADENWKADITVKVLESFMGAIHENLINVLVDDILIDNTHLKDIVYNENIVNKKSDKANIISQYLMFNGVESEKFHSEIVQVEDLGEVKVYVQLFEKEEAELAIKQCIMIRYPYMKILQKTINEISNVSVMCVIPHNNLSIALRETENAQHTKWEFARIDKERGNYLKNILSQLYKKINSIVKEFVTKKTKQTTPIEGTPQWVSSSDDDSNGNFKKEVEENTTNTGLKSNDPLNNNNSIEDQNGDGQIIDIGNPIPSGGDGQPPVPGPGGGGGKPNPGGDGVPSDDGIPRFVKEELRSMIYRFVCLNKKDGKYAIVFKSDYSINDVDLYIKPVDESNNILDLKISNVLVNGIHTVFNDDYSLKMDLIINNKYKIEFNVDQDEYFTCEVRAYANKE